MRKQGVYLPSFGPLKSSLLKEMPSKGSLGPCEGARGDTFEGLGGDVGSLAPDLQFEGLRLEVSRCRKHSCFWSGTQGLK